MARQTVKTVFRIAVLAIAVMVTVHILTHDNRSNWLALIPGVVLASAVFHFTNLVMSRRPARL